MFKIVYAAHLDDTVKLKL